MEGFVVRVSAAVGEATVLERHLVGIEHDPAFPWEVDHGSRKEDSALSRLWVSAHRTRIVCVVDCPRPALRARSATEPVRLPRSHSHVSKEAQIFGLSEPCYAEVLSEVAVRHAQSPGLGNGECVRLDFGGPICVRDPSVRPDLSSLLPLEDVHELVNDIQIDFHSGTVGEPLEHGTEETASRCPAGSSGEWRPRSVSGPQGVSSR